MPAEATIRELLDTAGTRICVLGLGRSGLAVTRYLLHRGLQVRALERNVTDALREAWGPLEAQGAQLVEGPHPADALDECALLVRSPGVPGDVPILQDARRRGIPIRSELSVAALDVRTPLLAITGTNGKSTTTAWTAHTLRRAGVDAVAAGNIGHALSAAVLEEGPEKIFVVEVSSFQLEDSPELHPRAAAILNLVPDHLDRHGSFEAYRAAKWAIAGSLEPGDNLVLGPEVEVPRDRAIAGRIIHCYPREGGPGIADAIYLRKGWICRSADGDETRLLPASELPLPGPHNLLNGMVALALASVLVEDVRRLFHGLRDFPGLPHRLEEVGTIGGVRMINDSKSTNVDSLGVALRSFEVPIVLIAGGRDKGGAFETLAEVAASNVRHLVVIGEAAERIAGAWPRTASERADDLEDAVTRALAAAEKGNVVLLSPGCASFDMFRDFEQRGEMFRDIVTSRRGKGTAS